MSRRMVWGVTLKCWASASIDMKPRWLHQFDDAGMSLFALHVSAFRWKLPWRHLATGIAKPKAGLFARFEIAYRWGKAATMRKGRARQGTRTMATKDLILSIDQGTTSTRAIAFSTGGDAVATAQKALPQIYPRRRLGRARSRRRSGRATGRGLPQGAGGGRRRSASAPSASPTSARPTVIWDREDRQGDPQRHRLAGPPRCAALQEAGRGRPRAHDPAEDRPPDRLLFLRDQDRLAAGERRRARKAAPRTASSPSAPSTLSCSGA